MPKNELARILFIYVRIELSVVKNRNSWSTVPSFHGNIRDLTDQAITYESGYEARLCSFPTYLSMICQFFVYLCSGRRRPKVKHLTFKIFFGIFGKFGCLKAVQLSCRQQFCKRKWQASFSFWTRFWHLLIALFTFIYDLVSVSK